MNIKSEKEEIDNIRNEVHELQEQSDLYRILTLEDRKNKRLCWLISLLIILLIVSVGYSFYLQNDIGTTITTEDYNKYMNVSNTLMEMFTKEIQNMKL